MTEAEFHTAQPDGADAAQEAGFSHCNSAGADGNRRQQFKDLNQTGRRAFVPLGNLRSGAADVKAVAARRDREQNQGQNGSQGERRPLTEETPDIQNVAATKTSAGGGAGALQHTSDVVTDQNGDIADQLAVVKAQIADLLDRIESLRPGFAKTVMPKIETQAMAADPTAKSQTINNQALLNSLEELTGLLEELIDLLKNNTTDTSDNAHTSMADVPPGYAPASNQPVIQDDVEIFMSIYDQLSPDTRLEVVEILAAMAFEEHKAGSDPEAQQAVGSGQATANESPLPHDDTVVTGDGVTIDALRAEPELLSQAGIQGVEVTGMELYADSDGSLSEASKIVVNKLISYLSDLLGGIEVVVNVYVDGNENMGVHLTAGEEDGAIFYPMEGTIYSSHVHTNGSWIPSIMDRENELAGAEDTIVVGDGVPGNETGDYFQYA
jgi:hypothetical protein